MKQLLKGLRSRSKEFKPLSRDPWIRTNSEIEPQKLHALGVITFRWNLSENKLFDIFGSLLKCSIDDAHALAHDLGDIALIRRIKALASSRIKNEKTLEAISNVLEVYDICRQNRNQLTHFSVRLVNWATPEATPGFELLRKRKDYRADIPFSNTIKDIRRVARDIRRLNTQLWGVTLLLNKKSRRWMTKFPSPLPLPELLCKPSRSNRFPK
jgi:hypothetical protein